MPVFTVSLNHQAPGFYDFGFIDKNKYGGTLTWFPVPADLPTPNLWGVYIHEFTIGQDRDASLAYKGIPAFIDSGGAFIFLPQAICDKYYSRAAAQVKKALVDVNHNGNPAPVYLFLCDETLPDLTIRIGTYKARIQGKLLRGANFDDKCNSSPLTPFLTKYMMLIVPGCVSSLMVSGEGVSIPANAALLGLPFLRTTFAAFSYDKRGARVGLAAKPIGTSFAQFSPGVNSFATPNPDCIPTDKTDNMTETIQFPTNKTDAMPETSQLPTAADNCRNAESSDARCSAIDWIEGLEPEWMRGLEQNN